MINNQTNKKRECFDAQQNKKSDDFLCLKIDETSTRVVNLRKV